MTTLEELRALLQEGVDCLRGFRAIDFPCTVEWREKARAALAKEREARPNFELSSANPTYTGPAIDAAPQPAPAAAGGFDAEMFLKEEWSGEVTLGEAVQKANAKGYAAGIAASGAQRLKYECGCSPRVAMDVKEGGYAYFPYCPDHNRPLRAAPAMAHAQLSDEQVRSCLVFVFAGHSSQINLEETTIKFNALLRSKAAGQ